MENFSFKSFLRNFYLTSFFYDFIFAYAIYNVLFNIRGLSIFQISLLLSWWAFVAMLFEIPTGALADSWSRKKMLIIAPIVKAFCFLIWFFANGNFYLYALGFVFWALGSSLVSGTSEAILYDTSVYAGKKDEYEKFLGKQKFYFNIALAVSTLSGGFIASYNLDLAVLFSILPLLLSALFASFLIEVPKVQSTGETKYFQYIKIAFKEIQSNRILIYLFIYYFAISILGNLEEFDQLYYQLSKLPIVAFGIIGFLWSSLNAISSYFAYKFKKVSYIFYLLPFLCGLFLIFVAKYPGFPMVGLLLISYFITTPVRILIKSRIQHNISSISRATVTSISTLMLNILGVLISPLFGLIAIIFNLQAIYFTTGIFLILFSIWVLGVRKTILTKTARST